MTQQITWRCAWLILAVALCSSGARAEKLTIERIFAAPDLSGPSLRAPQISPDGRLVAYLRGKDTDKDRLDLWAYDVRQRRHRLLVDSAALTPQERPLSAEEAQRRERQRISALSGIVEYQFSEDARYLLVPLNGDLYVYDLRAPASSAVRRLTKTEGYETDARFSPKGHYVSFIRDQNLFVYDLASGEEHAVTRGCAGLVSCGVAEFVAQEEMDRDTGYWWSLDEKQIAYTRVDESPVAEVERFEIYADTVNVVKQRYPAAGKRNASVELFVAPVAAPAADGGGPKGNPAAVRVDLGTDPDFYLARVNWFPDSRSLAVQKQSRDQKTLTLLKVDAASGAARELVTERSNTWVDLNDDLTFLKHSKQLIWASSRSGFKHLYLYDFEGTLVRQLTSGDWMAEDDKNRAVRGVDEQRGLVYFMANAESPLERHLYSVPLRAPQAGMRRITETAGWHSVKMSENAQLFLDTFSTPDSPPSITLRSADGKTVTTMMANTLSSDHPYARYLPDHVTPEFGTLKARDGQSLYYQIVKPRDLVPGKRYPVIVDVYGGPQSQRVRRAWGGNDAYFREYLAQHGYVVFMLDNRGTGLRGVKFETALYQHLSSVEVEDQLTGVEFLKSLPYVDPQRVGVFGWSYGGYMALMCMMKAPGVFAAGVSGAPVTDWRLYDTHYTERFMGTPEANPEGYADANVLNHADKLHGPLLIMHGMADDNVLFTNSTALFKKLQDLDKPFDVMTYPGSKHSLLRHASTGPHGYRMIERFFNEYLSIGRD